MAISMNSSNLNANTGQSTSNTSTLNQNPTNNSNIENGSNTESKVPLDECLICSDTKRDTIFKVKMPLNSDFWRHFQCIFVILSAMRSC